MSKLQKCDIWWIYSFKQMQAILYLLQGNKFSNDVSLVNNASYGILFRKGSRFFQSWILLLWLCYLQQMHPVYIIVFGIPFEVVMDILNWQSPFKCSIKTFLDLNCFKLRFYRYFTMRIAFSLPWKRLQFCKTLNYNTKYFFYVWEARLLTLIAL